MIVKLLQTSWAVDFDDFLQFWNRVTQERNGPGNVTLKPQFGLIIGQRKCVVVMDAYNPGSRQTTQPLLNVPVVIKTDV